jgi:hypothetical protein
MAQVYSSIEPSRAEIERLQGPVVLEFGANTTDPEFREACRAREIVTRTRADTQGSAAASGPVLRERRVCAT